MRMKPFICFAIAFSSTSAAKFSFSRIEKKKKKPRDSFIRKSLFPNESAIAKEIHVTASNLFTKNNQHLVSQMLAESEDEEQKL